VLPARGDWPWLGGAILCGGVAGPVLLMYGLSAMPASGASLLLNTEGVFTALLAWFVFRESFDRRIALGMASIVAGAVVLSWPEAVRSAVWWPTLAVLAACLAWALDNNLTRKVSLTDASWIAAWKGWAAGAVNLTIAATTVAHWPAWWTWLAAGAVGWLTYGVSLALFVIGLRHLGTARTAAYFSLAPFVGALLALPLLDEPVTPRLIGAGVLMALGVWLHLTEKHEHEHRHEPLTHTHEHVHDGHHQHDHASPVPPGTRHAHAHRHALLAHTHPHFPDTHHRHHH
jgi:drug/metabolite transporter (DMT)-like permease